MIKGADLISRVLGACVARIVAWRRTTIVVVLGLAAASLSYTAENLGINTDTANMISPELPWRRDFIAYRDSFPVRDNNVVVVVDGATAEIAGDFARSLAASLRMETDFFESVFLAGDGAFFERNGLLYLPLSDIEALSERLTAAQPLIAYVSERFDGARILDLAAMAVTEADGASAAELDLLLAELTASLEASGAGARRAIDWAALLDAPTDTTTRRILLVQPTLDFTRVQPARPSIDRLRELAATLVAESGADVRTRLTGTVAMEHEELVSVTQSASMAGLASLAMVTLVLIWALRSPTLLVIALVTLLTGLVFTAAFAAFAVGHLNLLSVAFAVLYVGLGVDFILHICLRLKELVAAGQGLDAALVETAQGVGTSLVICAVTTAVGFYAFIPTEFEGVSELGLISGTGMFVSLVVSLTLLPAFISEFWRGGATRLKSATMPRGLRRPDRFRPTRVIAVAAAVAAACAFLLPGLEFDGNPIRLRDPDSESIRTLEELAADREAPLFNLVALADDDAIAAAWTEALDKLDVVDRVLSVDSLVPEAQDDKAFLLEDLDFVLGPGFARVTEAPFEQGELIAAIGGLESALASIASQSPAESALLAAVRGWRRASENLDADARRVRLVALDADLRDDLPGELERLGRALQARPFTREDLPPELASRWRNEHGQDLIEIVPAEDVNDDAASERFVEAVRAVVPTATGLPVVYREASATVVRAFSLALTYALVLVTGLLLLCLHRVRDTLLVIVPILFAAIVTAGIAVLLDLPLNFANIIALPLLVGVGVDSGIHMVHRMRTEPPTDAEPLHTSTSRAVLASGLTTIASFGNLAFSSHVGMASMGQLLTLGMAVTLIATLVLLPALIRQWGTR